MPERKLKPTTQSSRAARGACWAGRWLCTWCLLAACKTAEDQVCLEQFSSAQAVVLAVDSKDLGSVDASIAAIDGAVTACRAAGRPGEVRELEQARGRLAAHRELLERQLEMIQKRTELSPEELARRIAQGDPTCPRGQAYLHKKSGKHIRCTGPQPIDMTREQAREYFDGRGYRVEDEDPSELRFKYGAELIVFRFTPEDRSAPASCALIYPPPDRSWQETTARLTGVPPARLQPGKSITVKRGSLLVAVDERPEKVLVRLGACP